MCLTDDENCETNSSLEIGVGIATAHSAQEQSRLLDLSDTAAIWMRARELSMAERLTHRKGNALGDAMRLAICSTSIQCKWCEIRGPTASRLSRSTKDQLEFRMWRMIRRLPPPGTRMPLKIVTFQTHPSVLQDVHEWEPQIRVGVWNCCIFPLRFSFCGEREPASRHVETPSATCWL
jgi:hypothetical protein